MTANVCVDGMEITLQAGSDWGWGSSASGLNLGNSMAFNVSSSGKKTTTNGSKMIIVAQDIITAMTAIVGEAYYASAFSLFGSGSDGTLQIVTLTSGLVATTKMTDQGIGVILDNVSGIFQIALLVPAQNSVPSADPGVPPGFHTGTWSITNCGQNPIVRTVS